MKDTLYAITMLLILGSMILFYAIVLIAAWRIMKAHEKIAHKISDIAEKFQVK